jgi:hypothetical protein
MIPRPAGPTPAVVREQANRLVVAFSPELDITDIIQQRLAKMLPEPITQSPIPSPKGDAQ